MEFSRPRSLPGELSIAPLIDVVFLLLVFFMLTSTMLQSHGIELQLPKASTAAPVEPSEISLLLQEKGGVSVVLPSGKQHHSTIAGLHSLLTELVRDGALSLPDELSFSLEAERGVPVTDLVTAMDGIRKIGGAQIALATHPLTSEPSTESLNKE